MVCGQTRTSALDRKRLLKINPLMIEGSAPGATTSYIGIDFKDEGTGSELSARGLDLARQAEAAGFESMWLNEDIGRNSIAMPEPYRSS